MKNYDLVDLEIPEIFDHATETLRVLKEREMLMNHEKN